MGFLDNAQSVYMNNNEVQSIIRNNDSAVLYEKSIPKMLTLTVNSGNSANLDSDDNNNSATFLATYTDSGIGVSNKPIILDNINETLIIDNVTVTNNNYVTGSDIDIGDCWELIGYGSKYSQIDIVPSDFSGVMYTVRIAFNSTTQFILSFPNQPGSQSTYLNGTKLYCVKNIFFTDEGEVLDCSDYTPYPYSKLHIFAVNCTIVSLKSKLGGFTDSNGQCILNGGLNRKGSVNVKAVSDDIESNTVSIHDLSTDPLKLTTNKSSITYGNNDYATLTAHIQDSQYQPLENQVIYFGYPSMNVIVNTTSGITNYNVSVGNSFEMTYNGNNLDYQYLALDSSNYHIIFKSTGEVVGGTSNNDRRTLWNSNFLKLKNGVLYDGNGNSKNISSYDNNFKISYITGESTIYIDTVGYCISDSNGDCSVQYIPVEVGTSNIKAISGQAESNTIQFTITNSS